jgi:hypothetical protein
MKEAIVNLINFGYMDDDFIENQMTFIYNIHSLDGQYYSKVIVGIAADVSFALFLN